MYVISNLPRFVGGCCRNATRCSKDTVVKTLVRGWVLQVCNKVHGGFTEEDLHFLDMLARQAAVTFDLCVKNDHRQTQIRKTTTMLKGFVKLAGMPSP